MKSFLDYVPGDSALHRLNPLTKLALAFGLCTSCFLTRNHALVVGVMLLNLFQAAIAGVLDRSLKMLSALVKLSVVLFLAQLFFVREGRILLALPFGLYITDAGLSFSLLFVLRLVAATMPLAMMLSITRMSDISNALVRGTGIPYKYAFVLTTAIRLIPLFADEMAEIMEAQIARGVEFDTKNFFKKLRLILPLCVPLLISSVRKIEDGAISAELRGFNLRNRNSGYKRYPFGVGDAAVLALCALVMAASVMI
ncbi:MAG: energy-coupling factor transporter transmembrane protein EcfT [Synergistaceae bacterium]|nr:energy-coupling factor transporter transmembrane protein EcfT [Synergistaceae bacterium]